MAFPSAADCAETVSIIYAVFRGAGDACVSIDTVSVLLALAPFVAGVMILQWLARRLWARMVGRGRPEPQVAEKSGPFDTDYDGGPIRSTRSWRS